MNNNTVELISQLLRMAEHPNSNEYEAAQAMERAQALMLKANLTRAQVNTGTDKTDSFVESPIGQITRVEHDGYVWKRGLLNSLAKTMLCHVVVTPSKNEIHLFGTYGNVKAVLEMYQWLVPQLEAMSIRQYSTYKDEGGLESAGTWRPQFYYGATKTIRERLEASLDAFQAGDGKAVCIWNSKAVSTAVHKVFPRLFSTSSRHGIGGDGYSAGRQAGSSIHLRQQGQLSHRLALR